MQIQRLLSITTTLALALCAGSIAPADGAPWPDRAFAPYVDLTLSSPYDMAAQSTKYFSLAFVVGRTAGNCRGMWGGVLDAAPGADGEISGRLSALRAKGGDFAISFGGAAGLHLQQACTSAQDLKNELRRIVDAYKAGRLDFDIEGSVEADEAANSRLTKALAELQAERPDLEVTYTLPVMPTGLTQSGMRVLSQALQGGVKLRAVNVMTMNYGGGFTGNQGEYALQAGNALARQIREASGSSISEEKAKKMVGLTPMLGVNDVRENVFTVQDAERVVAGSKAAGFGFLSFWSVHRDNSGVSGVPQEPGQFTRIFQQGSGRAQERMLRA